MEDYLQKMFDRAAEQERKKRATEQMTLGQLIEQLEKMNPKSRLICSTDTSIKFCGFSSFRGYYSDLALSYTVEWDDEGTVDTVKDLLEKAKSCVNKTFTGWKGGDFVMGLDTPLWVANMGHTSDIVIDHITESNDCCFVYLGIKEK